MDLLHSLHLILASTLSQAYLPAHLTVLWTLRPCMFVTLVSNRTALTVAECSILQGNAQLASVDVAAFAGLTKLKTM